MVCENMNRTMIDEREKWIDYIKVFACVLVFVGHFFMSMVSAEILTETTLYHRFIKTIYYVHVPLFSFVVDIYIKKDMQLYHYLHGRKILLIK